MFLFSFVFFLDAETEVVVQIPSAEILFMIPSGEGSRFFMDTQSSNYKTVRIRHCVDALVIRA
jgi:hypothetical protein